MAELGVVTTLPSAKQSVGFARLAETLGFTRVGMADTAPKLYHGVYPSVTASLLATERITIGTFSTNPVTRHWSVQGATARALDDLAPNRFFMGIGTGDGAVHSVGLKPSKLDYLQDYIEEMRPLLPESTKIHMVSSGTKGAELAGRLASELTLGTGVDAGALRELAGRARAARRAAGIADELQIWGMATTHFAESESDVPALREHVRGLAYGGARFSFDFSFDGKNVPEDYQPILRAQLAKYDHAYHAKTGDHPNAHLFDDYPEIGDYLLNRMALIGTPEQCAKRLGDLIREGGIDGIWIPVIPWDGAPPSAQLDRLRLVSEAFGHLVSTPS
jgi:alkanesulfonate monooxygenase SsuD/methylene tetrahydromethanopterin reductase-like flavin-dependent oxidoreductase (luciferase family)